MKKISFNFSGSAVCLAAMGVFGWWANLAADESGLTPLAEKGELLLSDDFSREDLGEKWKTVIPTFSVSDGLLHGSQTRDDHGAVGRASLEFQDAVIEFRMRLAGSPTVNAVCDDKNYKGSHAGHICRVAFAAKQIRIGDDKEGVMRNDIFEMRKDPSRKAEADKLLEGRGATIKQGIDQQRWYEVRIEIVGDTLQVSLDGKPVGRLSSPGIAHPTKTSFHFTVNGTEAQFDDVKIWAAKPAK